MKFDELNESNYMLFAIKFYDNPQSVTKEDFEDDLKRIKYIKRLLKRYQNNGELKVHLILNHLTVLFNVFNEATVPILFYNLEKDLWPSIKSFLVFWVGFLNIQKLKLTILKKILNVYLNYVHYNGY